MESFGSFASIAGCGKARLKFAFLGFPKTASLNLHRVGMPS